MKKKLVFSNSILVTFIFLVRTCFSCFASWKINKSNQETSRRQELVIVQRIYEEAEKSYDQSHARQKTIAMISDSDNHIRVTFLNLNGDVLEDSDRIYLPENHLERKEINDIGTIYYRHSDTLNKNRMYLACRLDNGYIRLAKPTSSVRSIRWERIILSASLTIAEIILLIVINILLVNHTLKPLQTQLNRLSHLGDSQDITVNSLDVDVISDQIDKTQFRIQDKRESLREEEEKLSYIINRMHQGLIVLNSNQSIILINSMAKTIFDYKDKENPNLTDLTINPDRLQFIRDAMEKGDASLEMQIQGRYYLFTADYIQAEWVNSKSEKAIAISVFDRTSERLLENTKRDFFANASHELKTPLTTIIGFSERIKNGFLSDKEDINSALSRITFESKRRNEIVRQRLDLSRLETEDIREDLTNLSRKGETEARLAEFGSLIQSKKISPSVSGDDFTVKRKKEDCNSRLKNLIENAVRYNKDGGKIIISFDSKNRSLSISDTGIGIPEDQIPRIFERFYRVDKAHSRKLGGTGLGLSIVKHICRNYHIQIDVKSKIAAGSTFTLTFSKTKDY